MMFRGKKNKCFHSPICNTCLCKENFMPLYMSCIIVIIIIIIYFFKGFETTHKTVDPTKNLSDNHAAILSIDSGPSVPLVGVLNEGVALVDGAAHDLAILGKDGLHVRLGDQQRVQVADEDPRVERAWVRLVGDVAGHQAGGGG